MKSKGDGRGDEVEGGIWPTQKFWRGASYARLLAGLKRAASGQRGEGKGREVRGTAREKRGRNEKKWRGGKLEQGRRLAKAGHASPTNKPVITMRVYLCVFDSGKSWRISRHFETDLRSATEKLSN